MFVSLEEIVWRVIPASILVFLGLLQDWITKEVY